MFRKKTLWSGFWTALVCPRPDDPVIDLTAISTLGITMFSIAVKTVPWTQFSTAAATLSFFLLYLSVTFLSITWS